MAKRQRTKKSQQFTPAPKTGLEPAYPASPLRNPRYAVYARYPASAAADQGRVCVYNFYGTYAAKHFVNAFLAGGGFKWLAARAKLGYTVPDTIVGDNGVELCCPPVGGEGGMEAIIEHEFNTREAAWEMEDRHRGQIAWFLASDEVRAGPAARETATEDGAEATVKREKRDRTPRPDKTGLVSVSDIAKQMGIEPFDARDSLRRQKVDKPSVGWTWPTDQVESVKEIIAKGLRKK